MVHCPSDIPAEPQTTRNQLRRMQCDYHNSTGSMPAFPLEKHPVGDRLEQSSGLELMIWLSPSPYHASAVVPLGAACSAHNRQNGSC